jgi:hypothetical protein
MSRRGANPPLASPARAKHAGQEAGVGGAGEEFAAGGVPVGTHGFRPARIRITAVNVKRTSAARARRIPDKRSARMVISAPRSGMPTVTATRWLVVSRPVARPLWASGTPEVAVTVAATTAVI